MLGIKRRKILRLNYYSNFQTKFMRKFKITLIMGWHCHNCASTIIDQDIICNPNRYALIIHWVNCITTGKDSGLFFIEGFSLNLCFTNGLTYISFNFFFLFRCSNFFNKRMFRRQHHKGCAPQSIWAGCKNFQWIVLFSMKGDYCSF